MKKETTDISIKQNDPFLVGNEVIEAAIHQCYENISQSAVVKVLSLLHMRMRENGHFIVPVDSSVDEDGNEAFEFNTLEIEEGKLAAVAFTGSENYEKSPPCTGLSHFMDSVLMAVCEMDEFDGILLNPWGESFFLTKEMIRAVLDFICVDPEPYVSQPDPYLAELDSQEKPYVNAHINNISFPTSIEELEVYVYEHGMYNVEDILTDDKNTWTVPRSAKIGDVVLFYHAKTAIARITALITQVKALPEESGHDKLLLLDWLDRARNLFKQYGGKIFAIARVTGSPEYWPAKKAGDIYHWHGRIYADVGDIAVLEKPVDISEFNDFIKVSRQSAITPLPSEEFRRLRKLIGDKNVNLPTYFSKCEIGNVDLSHINRENFLQLTQEYRRRFLLEIDFRSYYVDHLLKSLAKRKVWRECTCHALNKPNCFVDNVIEYEGTYYLIEVKLNVRLEQDLHQQLKQYVNADYLYLDKASTKKVEKFERRYMYVIDTEAFYRYDAASDSLVELVQLDDVHCIEDIVKYLSLDKMSPHS